MITPASIGIVVAILSVMAAYWVGYSAGFTSGQDRGYGDGKRDGAKQGSMRGYAVGYDRGKRQAEGSADGDEEEATVRRRGLSVVGVGLALAVAGIFYLASSGSKQKATRRLSDPQRSSAIAHDRAQPALPQRSFKAHESGSGERPWDATRDRSDELRERWITRERDAGSQWDPAATAVPQR